MLPYGEHFKRQRRLIQEYMSSKNLYHFRALQELEAATLVQEILGNPDAYSKFTKRYVSRIDVAGVSNEVFMDRFSAGVIMKLAYGYTITSVNDEFVVTADRALTGTVQQASGLMMVDLIPFGASRFL